MTATTDEPKPPRGLDKDWILSGTRGWISLVSCNTDLVSWLQFKFSCSRPTATKAAAWAQSVRVEAAWRAVRAMDWWRVCTVTTYLLLALTDDGRVTP